MGDFGSALEKNVAELTVMDVYDIAAVVGQEFERIIDQYGCEALSRLMPKIVRVLEILEVLVSRNNISPETEELRLELDRLRVERMDRLEKEKKQKKELEQVEDVWRGEAQDLLSQISQLQAENQTLLTSLSMQDTPTLGEELQRQDGVSEREKQVMRKLKGIVDKQRDEIRAKDRELTLRNEEVEALQQQQSRLMRINQDLRRRVGVVEAQGKALIQQRAGLEAGLQARQQELGELQKEVSSLREQLQEESRPTGEESPLTLPPEEPEECPVEDNEVLELKDPNRPRFTLQELRDVLHERNELKAQVFMLQEEVAYYRSEELEEGIATPPSVPAPLPQPNVQPESGIKRLIFTAIMPMVAAGLLADDPTLQPIRRLVSFV